MPIFFSLSLFSGARAGCIGVRWHILKPNAVRKRINILIKIQLDFDLPDNYTRVLLFSGLFGFDEVCSR